MKAKEYWVGYCAEFLEKVSVPKLAEGLVHMASSGVAVEHYHVKIVEEQVAGACGAAPEHKMVAAGSQSGLLAAICFR